MKKKSLYITSLLVLVNVWTVHAGVQGALPGAFSVSATKKVYFSQGNLQYQASTKTWRFASAQYTRVGASGNNKISATYTGWIDWFAWGTGSNPISTSSSFTDWGVNTISNGGNQANLWRTLTKDEWEYLFSGRANAANRRSTATVNNVVGYIFLPDNWTLPSGLKFVADVQNKWETNKYSLEDWQKMEQNGAVFLPKTASISKSNTGLTYYDAGWNNDEHCQYWSSTQKSSSEAHMFSSDIATGYYSGYSVSISSQGKNYRLGVRLVIDSDKNTFYTITWKNWDGTTLATISVLKGATPSYTGATPTRPSTAEYAYTFSGWTPAITAATANKTYTATYTATPRHTITFNANGGLIPTGGNMGKTPSGHITTLSADRTFGTVVVTKDKSHFQTMTNDCPSREGYTFAGWYTDPTSGVQVYDNTGYRVVGTYWNSEGNWIGTSNVTLYAHWTPIPYTITVNSSNVSQGTAAGGGTYDYGTNQQISATPNECYRFVQWSDGNTDNPRTVLVTEDKEYAAIFDAATYNVNATTNDDLRGKVSITQPTIPYVGFTATADNSSIKLQYNGTLVGCIPQVQYSYDGQSWKKLEEGTKYNVEKGQTIYMRGHNPNGVSIRFDGYSSFVMQGSFDGSGDLMTLVDSTGMTTEAPDYCFYRLFRNCTSLTKAPRLTATTVNYQAYVSMFSGCTNLQYIEVDFTKWNTDATAYWVSSIASTGTFVKPTALSTSYGTSYIPSGWTVIDKETNDSSTSNVTSGTYECETTLILTATPNDCYQFTKWSDGNTDNPRTIVVSEDATYTAEFTPVQYTIKVESADESQGTVSVEK